MRPLLALLIVSLTAIPSGRQTAAVGETDSASLLTTSFIECARAGTEKYHDQAAAVVDGYRRIGRDFPAMGEHWIRIALVFDGKIEASRPEVLSYVRVDDQPRLVGVAYAVPLLGAELPPNGPAGPEAWHDHSRTVEDETILPLHHASGAGHDGARLSMMHAWIWSTNPAGMFAADNWAIPYIRLGLADNPAAPVTVAKALSLATGGRDYFERAIEAAARSTAAEQQRVSLAMDGAESEVQSLARDVHGTSLDDAQNERLALVWANMWSTIDDALSAAARERVSNQAIR